MCSERILSEIRAQWKDPTFAKSMKRQLELSFQVKKKHEDDCLMLQLILKADIGNKENWISPCMSAEGITSSESMG